jgi:hypothetical protein
MTFNPIIKSLALTAACLAAAAIAQSQPTAPAPAAVSAKQPVVQPKLGKSTKQEMRMRHRMATLKTGDKEYDPSDLLKAKEQKKTMKVSPMAWPSSQQAPNGSVITPLAAGIQPSNWTPIGPRNIGGRTRSLLPHPTDPNIVYAGAVSGGIWKSVNGGANWTPLNDFLPSLIVSCMVMDPKNPNILYAGTGEYFRGAGVFKTTDGGTTWNRLASTNNASWNLVRRIAISPANSQIVLAATDGGVFRSTDGGATFGMAVPNGAYDVDFHPTDGNKAFATTNARSVFYTLDGGLNWTPSAGVPEFTGRTELAVSKSNPNIVYAAVDINSGELFRSSDGGRTFVSRYQGGGFLYNQGWWDNVIWVDPTNSERIMWGGVWMWRSLDGGFTWEQLWNGEFHADQHHIVEATGYSATNRTVWVTNDGGIYKTSDFLNVNTTAPFIGRNMDYSVSQFYSGTGHPTTGMIMGGTQDNGTPRYNGTANDWLAVGCCDGTFIAADPVIDPDGSSYFYGGSQLGESWRAKMRPDGTAEEIYGLWGANNDSYIFIHPQVLDQNSPQRLYKGGFNLWRLDNPRTADPGTLWTQVSFSGGSQISAIAVAPANSSIIWIGRTDGTVQMTVNGLVASPTWTQRGAGVLPFSWVTDITVDPANTNRVYATFSGFSPNNVWKTEDAGVTWTDITSNLPDVPVRSLTVNRFNTNHIYIGTEIGIFASENRGGAWSPSNEGPANVPTDELFWMGNRLVAATHGRGMFRITVNTPPNTALTAPANNATFAAGSNITLTATATDPDGTVAKVEFFQGSTPIGAPDTQSPWTVVWSNVPAGTYVLTSRATDNDGGVRTSAGVTITVSSGPGSFRNPIADAYVRNGTAYAGTNFGTANPLSVKTNASVDVNRDAYLRFDVSGLSGFVGSAKLRAFGKLSETGTANIGAYAVPVNTWAENTLTWNNKPALGPLLATRAFSGTAETWYEWDVTAQLRKERARTQTSMTLGLHGTAAVNPLATIRSREDATTANRPQLTYTMTSPTALFVVGNVALGTGDAAVRNRLQAMGFTLVIKDAASATTADAAGKALVLISATVTSGSVNTKYRATDVPVINWEQAIQDDMAMTGAVTGDYGTAASQTQVKILNAAHALAGGLSGTVTVAASAQAFNFGKPSASAILVGAVIGNDAQLAAYGYEKNAAMVGLAAPGRRVNLFMTDTTPAAFNDAGWSLFDAAVYWASGL